MSDTNLLVLTLCMSWFPPVVRRIPHNLVLWQLTIYLILLHFNVISIIMITLFHACVSRGMEPMMLRQQRNFFLRCWRGDGGVVVSLPCLLVNKSFSCFHMSGAPQHSLISAQIVHCFFWIGSYITPKCEIKNT